MGEKESHWASDFWPRGFGCKTNDDVQLEALMIGEEVSANWQVLRASSSIGPDVEQTESGHKRTGSYRVGILEQKVI